MDKYNFPNILPVAMKVASKMISNDLVSVQPMKGFSIPENKVNEIKNRLKSENRTSKLDSLIDNKEHIEKKLDDDSEYQELKKDISPNIKLIPILNIKNE